MRGKRETSRGIRAWLFALQVYVPLRLAMSGLAALVRGLYAGDLTPDPVLRPYLGAVPIEGGWRGLLLGVWQRWDTLWYMLIAREGYSITDTRIFAPPLYPWLMRLIGSMLGGHDEAYLLAGLMVSNLACIALFYYLFRLVTMEVGMACARRTVVYLAIFPTAFFLLAGYAESLFLLCIVAAFYHARRGQWVAAGVWSMFAPLARLPGAVIVVPLGWEYARQWWVSRQTSRPLPWWHVWPLMLTVAGTLAFPAYAYLVVGSGSWLAPFAIHTQRFAGHFAMPWASLWQAVRVLASGSFRVIEPLDLLFAVSFIALTVAAFRELPVVYGVYMAVVLAGTLTKVAEVQPLLSASRYVLALFPGFVVLARWVGRNSLRNRLVVYLSCALLVFLSGQFVIWGWVG
jgi:hypothetical protein